VALALGLAVAPAFATTQVDPSGSWEVSTGEARFEVTLCGDGTQLCAELTWLRDDARTPENLAYLNALVINGANNTTPVKWKGTVQYDGEAFTGTLTMLNANTLKVSGCQAIACESLLLNRI
jgi:uncharacterized protein (DUF2147 family)